MHTSTRITCTHDNDGGTHQMGYAEMPTNIRLTNSEQEALRKKCIEINKLLVKMGHQPVKDSELVHAIFAQVIEKVEVSNSGQITVRE